MSPALAPWPRRAERILTKNRLVSPGRADAVFALRPYTRTQRAWFAALELSLAAPAPLLRVGGRGLQHALASVFGSAAAVLMRRKRRIALINLDLAYGDELTEREKRRIVRRMFVHFVRLGLDFVYDSTYWPAASLVRRVPVENAEALEACRAAGKGYVIVTAHSGNWELLCRVLAARGFDLTAVFKPPHGAFADRFIGRRRQRSGIHLLQAKWYGREEECGLDKGSRRSLREPFDRLRASNRGVVFLCDQFHRGGSALRIPFLGVPETPTSGGLLRYALAHELPIALAHCVYEPGGGARCWIEDPIYPEAQPGGEEATLDHYARLINDRVSAAIRAHPDQWTWGHRRFERSHYERPRGAEPPRAEAPAS